jgi:undecaprenyl-diphosphatase
MFSAIQQLDFTILNFIHSNMHSALLDKIMPVITFLGNGGAIWIIIALGLTITRKYRVTGIMMICALVLCLLVGNLAIKPLVARSRPCWVNTSVQILIPNPQDFSFPSGHTLSSFAAATVLFLRNRRWGLWSLLLAALIAFSRLYLYVHYPSDVITGLALGIVIAFMSVKAEPLIVKYFRKPVL